MSVHQSTGWLVLAPLRYVRWHLRAVRRFIWAGMIRTPPRVFVMLLAMRQLLFRIPVRIAYDAADDIFSASDSTSTLFFLERNRAMLYDRGILPRANSLANQYFMDMIPFRPNDLVVDCGANVGELYFYVSNLPVPVRYRAYEPGPREFLCLKRNATGGTCRNAGLWDEVGDKTLFVSSFGADSSFIEPREYEAQTAMAVARLDMEVSEPIRLLKLEAEGAEPEAIRGSENVLPIIDYIAADLGPERGREEANTVAEVTNYLLARNFVLVKVSTQRTVLLFRNKATTTAGK